MVEYFKKQFPVYYFLIALLGTSLIFFYVLNKKEKALKEVIQNGTSANGAGGGYSGMGSNSNESNATINQSTAAKQNAAPASQKNEKRVVRASSGGFTRPILLVETTTPAAELSTLDNSLKLIIDAGKQSGKVQSASVYINDMDNDNWIEVNDTEGYYPGSLMKLAVFMCYLKKSEEHPEILNKQLVLDNNVEVPGQSYKDETIRPNTPYKVSDLFYPMIVRSDNFATLLLNRELDINELNKLFMTLGIKKMDMQNIRYTITASDYSKFMRVLYNATYLNVKNSQYALTLLSNSTFSRGLTRELPKNVVVAHKFGENVSGNVRQLHESGIVYTGAHTYLITIMTKGTKVTDLADVISDISTQAYQFFKP